MPFSQFCMSNIFPCVASGDDCQLVHTCRQPKAVRLTGDLEVAGSVLVGLSIFFRGDLFMKYFLPSLTGLSLPRKSVIT